MQLFPLKSKSCQVTCMFEFLCQKMGNKKDKKRKKKKHKKEKQKKLVTSSSSESESNSSDGEEVWVEKKPSAPSLPQDVPPKQDAFDLFFSETSKTRKDLKESSRSLESEDIEKEKQTEPESELESTITSRELNPFWKSGNKGLPPSKSDVTENSDVEVRSSQAESGTVTSRALSPQPEVISRSKLKESESKKDEITQAVSLNKLSAALFKAELMGDTAKMEQLKQEIELAKQAESSTGKTEVLLMKTSASGASYPVGKSESNVGHHKRKGKIETHDKDGKRLRYSADEDGQSIQDLVMRERSQTATNQNAALMKLMGKSSRGFESLDDMFVTAKAQKKSGNVENELLEKAAKEEQKKAMQTLDECYLCFNSPACKQRLVVKSSQYAYISLPFDSPLVNNHCLISPVLHYTCSTLLDEEVYDEIETLKRLLIDKFYKLKRRVIFVECFRSSNKFFHMSIECIPVRKSAFAEAPMFFKKAIMESEEEWSMNKKLVDLKNNDVRRTIPKGLSYFTVQFGMEKGGFAHVIEDCRLFPRYFARQVLGGILDLDDFVIHKPKPLSMEQQLENVKKFKTEVLDSK